ncbi:MAG: DUF1987 domain-containing protein [Bacteroidales bacterium]|nr:MAG: DUF1987 domain-containing protein [Bacteroidales bacterium]
MKPLIVEPTIETPKITLNPEANVFEISGQSLPENALEFYLPVVSWLEQYSHHPNPVTEFNFRLEYFNTASSRMIFKVLSVLKSISTEHKVNLKWYYHREDPDMLASGKRFARLVTTDFEFIES